MAQLVKEVRRSRGLPSPARARAIRQDAEVSQQRMASELGVHRVTVARWEAGRRRPRGQHRDAYAALLHALEQEIR
jgi:DNA-binding transcriptional regulator YiaG